MTKTAQLLPFLAKDSGSGFAQMPAWWEEPPHWGTSCLKSFWDWMGASQRPTRSCVAQPTRRDTFNSYERCYNGFAVQACEQIWGDPISYDNGTGVCRELHITRWSATTNRPPCPIKEIDLADHPSSLKTDGGTGTRHHALKTVHERRRAPPVVLPLSRDHLHQPKVGTAKGTTDRTCCNGRRELS